MPTYDYKCSACGHAFEKFQSISAAALKKCPKCGKSALKRLIGTGAGVIFRGGGFYETDYRSESYKAAAKAESGGGDKSTDKGGEKAGRGEGKSAAKDRATSAGESKPPGEAGPKQSKRRSA